MSEPQPAAFVRRSAGAAPGAARPMIGNPHLPRPTFIPLPAHCAASDLDHVLLQSLSSSNGREVAIAIEATQTLCAGCIHAVWHHDGTGLACRCPVLARDTFDAIYRIDRCGACQPRTDHAS